MGPDNSPDRENYCSVCRIGILLLRTKARQKLKILRNKFEKQVSLGHRVIMLRLGYCKKLLLHVHFGCWAWKAKRIHNGIGPAHLHETWTGPGRYLDLSSSRPTSYRFQEVSCERKAYLEPICDRSQIYPVPCKRGLSFKYSRSRTFLYLSPLCT